MASPTKKCYCLVQSNLDPIDPQVLKMAFRAVGELVDNDAKILSADAFGILADGLTVETARTLANELAKAGVVVEVVPEEEIPTLPDPHTLRRCGCFDNVFMASDSLGREVPWEWSQVVLVSVGIVPLREAKRIMRTRYRMLAGGISGCGLGSMPMVFLVPERDVSIRYKRESRGLLDIFMDCEPYRYRIWADKFNFSYLGQRRSRKKLENFVQLVEDFTRYASGAALNRGAVAIRDDGLEATFGYPSRHAFEEETVWLLYRLGLSRGQSWAWIDGQ